MTYASRLTFQRAFPTALALLAALSGFAIARLPLPTLAAATAIGAVVIGALIEPAIGLIVTLIVGPWAAWQNTYLPGLLPTDIGQLCLALTLGAWLLHSLLRREFNLPRIPLLIPLSIFTSWAAVSMLWAPDYTFGLPEVLKWSEMALVALFVVDTAQRRGIKWPVIGLLLSATTQAVIGIYQARIRGIGPEGFLLSPGVYRAYGTFEQPNPFAGFIGLGLPIAIGLAVALWAKIRTRMKADEENKSAFVRVHRRPISALIILALTASAIAVILAIALYLSFSRGAWLGAVAALVAIGLFLPRRRWIGLGAIGGLIVMGLILNNAGLLPAAIADRFADVGSLIDFRDVRGVKINDANYAVVERLAHWQAAVRMIEANPWTGVGFSNYQPVYEQYRLLNWPMPLGHAHNIYLNVAAETGLPGLVAYLVLWIAIFAQTLRALKTQSGVRRGLALGLLGAWVHLSVHHVFDNLYVNNAHVNLGAMIGLLSVLYATHRT